MRDWLKAQEEFMEDTVWQSRPGRF